VKSLFVASLVFVALLQPAMAAKKKHVAHKTKASASATAATSTENAGTKRHLGTDHSFSAADVRGRYQYPAGGTVTVENDKDLIDLLGMRKHFKDRLDVETTRN
jgi:hypothetical protein